MTYSYDFGLTPEQYHAGVDNLWKALGITEVQDEDVFTLAAREINQAKKWIELKSDADLPKERCSVWIVSPRVNSVLFAEFYPALGFECQGLIVHVSHWMLARLPLLPETHNKKEGIDETVSRWL